MEHRPGRAVLSHVKYLPFEHHPSGMVLRYNSVMSSVRTSFRTVKPAEYADAYMMQEQLALDRRKARIDRLEQGVVQQLIDALPAGATVADVPSGNGRMTQLVRRTDLRVVAMDFNRSMLEAISRRDLPGLLPRRAQADITALPLPDQSVDLFINMRLIHHIEDHAVRVRMLKEIARVTRTTIVSSFWTTHCWRHWRKKSLGKQIRGCPIPPGEFRACCAEAGLTVQRLVPVRRWLEDEVLAICTPARQNQTPSNTH